MKKIVLIFSVFAFISCQNTENKEETSQSEIKEEVEITVTKHGKDISEEGAITVAEFLSQMEGKDSLFTKITAPINEVCAKKGCWMTLNLGNDNDMRVKFKDYDFFVPKDAGGKIAIVEGFARLDTTSIEELKHYLEDANASQEEIDAITEPEIDFVFEAEGVIIKEEKLLSNETK